MKTIIISDITEPFNSIIPYGLNIGKYTQTRVEILHLVDPRQKEGTSSPYADSQTVSPAEKLSHQDILQKQANKARTLLDRLLSKEASRLNYPLRVNQVIEIDPAQQAIDKRLMEDKHPLLITGTTPGQSMAGSLGELLMMFQDVEFPILIVPPDQRFIKPASAVMVTNLKEAGNEVKFRNLFQWLKPFNTSIFACSLGKDEALTTQQQTNSLRQVLQEAGAPSLVQKSGVMEGGDPIEVVKGCIDKHKPDLVILPKNNKVFADFLFQAQHAKQFIDSFGLPVLLY